MKLRIDKQAAHNAIFLTSTAEYGDIRRYYELDGAIIVCRNDVDLMSSIGRVVDAQAGWDTAIVGFTVNEDVVGQARSKITVYRIVRGRYDNTLTGQIGESQ